MYIHTQTLVQASEQEIRTLYPNTSFPNPFVPPDEYAYIFPTPQPEYDPVREYVHELKPILTDKGHYEQQWEIVKLSPEQIADNVEAARIASVPVSLTRRQFKLALIRSSLYETVESMIAASTDLELKVTYQEALEFERHNPMVLLMAVLLNKTEEDIDNLFILGSTL